MLTIIDSILDGTYLAASMVDYTAACATTSLEASQALKAKFYQVDELPLALCEITLFILYSLIGRVYKDSKPQEMNWLTQYLVLSWPYFRDFISGLKNGRHAIVNMSFLLNLGSPHFVYTLANPIGILTGIALAFNLVWYRHMNTLRNEGIKANNVLAESKFSETQIYRHSYAQRAMNFMASAFDGLTDGMYLYGCLFILVNLGLIPTPGSLVFIVALVCINLITLSAFISKVHDEYLYQQELKASEIKCELALANAALEIEKEEITSKQEVFTNLTTPSDPLSFTFIGKLIFFTFRGTLSGAKNAVAAFNSIKNLVSQGITTLVLCLFKLSITVGYALYLGAKAATTEFKKRKIPFEFNLFNTEPHYSKIDARTEEYRRDNFV